MKEIHAILTVVAGARNDLEKARTEGGPLALAHLIAEITNHSRALSEAMVQLGTPGAEGHETARAGVFVEAMFIASAALAALVESDNMEYEPGREPTAEVAPRFDARGRDAMSETARIVRISEDHTPLDDRHVLVDFKFDDGTVRRVRVQRWKRPEIGDVWRVERREFVHADGVTELKQ